MAQVGKTVGLLTFMRTFVHKYMYIVPKINCSPAR